MLEASFSASFSAFGSVMDSYPARTAPFWPKTPNSLEAYGIKPENKKNAMNYSKKLRKLQLSRKYIVEKVCKWSM